MDAVLYIVFFLAAWISLITANVHLATSAIAALMKKDYGTEHRRRSNRMVLVHFAVTALLFYFACRYACVVVYS